MDARLRPDAVPGTIVPDAVQQLGVGRIAPQGCHQVAVQRLLQLGQGEQGMDGNPGALLEFARGIAALGIPLHAVEGDHQGVDGRLEGLPELGHGRP